MPELKDATVESIRESPPSVRPRSKVASRNLQLDVLRCIAILLVIGAHIKTDNFSGIAGWLALNWQTHGWLGVPIFFALSGYLISGLIFDELRTRHDFRVGRFLIRRGFKLYPSYYLFLIALVGVPLLKDLHSGRDAFGILRLKLVDLWPNLLFLQNYVGPNPALHTWSLAVEEHFYLLLPFGMLALYRRKRLALLTVLGLGSPLLFTAIRYFWVYYFSSRFSITGWETHMILDGLLMGVGLRALKEHSPEFFDSLRRWRWIAVFMGVFLLLFVRGFGYLSLTPVGSTLLLLGALHLTAADFGGVRRIGSPIAHLMGWVGMYSYSIYLWHPTFTGFAEKYFISHLHLDPTRALDWFVNRSLIVIAIILGGWFVSRLVEWPVLRFRDRYFPSRA